ncbi:hypothetical protein [Streptomyces ipomoeae]|uniref:hypothetical protein n=1 Tax=Streptomyces ipomoeae TaxID=103232 RepID=UPI0011474EA1|nr:hypothetical protein [Streptomyces ipomoeae]MDX2939645.1 hypothetical protein [Streptomyces ipomoeae]TQE32205.1 hypothetical protein SipoB123_00055 [Streptomyces ipomoeae]
MGTIARALQGPHVPDWATTGRIVFALDGDLADTKRLWHAVTHPPPTVPRQETDDHPITPTLR